MKHCNTCGEDKPQSEFYKRAASNDGLSSQCKDCIKARKKLYYEKNKDDIIRKSYSWKERNPASFKASQRKSRLKRNFGVTVEQYDALLSEQGGTCAICGCNHCGTGKLFAVDHNHDTGVVRGLLCSACNTGLGLLKDSPSILDSAIQYLKIKGTYDRSNQGSSQAPP